MLKTSAEELSLRLGVDLPVPFKGFVFDLRVQGYMKTQEAPVIIADDHGQLQLKMMKFSLCPSWSKEFPCAFTTYNARMERPKKGAKAGVTERIYQVPTWRESFVKGQTCLVPMNAAIESSYFGLSAGNMIRFINQDHALYFVVGLWSQWVNKDTGEVHDTFTLITDDPYRFFFDHGHDRSVVVIDEGAYKTWLTDRELKPEERFDLLRESRVNLPWGVEVDRPMKAGWEKRAPSSDEIDQIRVWG